MTTLGIVDGLVLLPDLSVEPADVLVDRTSGEIVSVGDVRTADERLDASGGLVVPGLVNAHTHTPMTLFRGYPAEASLERWLETEIQPLEAALQPEDVRVGAELALLEMIKSGTTGFVDMYVGVSRIAAATDAAGLRARLGHGHATLNKSESDAWASVRRGLATARKYDESGSPIASAYMPHSLEVVGERYLREAVAGARDLGVPIHYHANETAAQVDEILTDRGVRPLAYADELGMLADGDSLAHCVHVDDAEIRLLADRGAAVVHCPAANAKLNSGVAPVRRMLDSGVTVGLGTDGAASNDDLDMFREMRLAAKLGAVADDDGGPLAPETVVGMATTGSAAAAGFDSGRIEPGRNADLVVIDDWTTAPGKRGDPAERLVYGTSGGDVRHTVCDGEVLMRDRTVLTLDERRIRRTAQRHAGELVRRA